MSENLQKLTRQKGDNNMQKQLERLKITDFDATEKDMIQGLIHILLQDIMKGVLND